MEAGKQATPPADLSKAEDVQFSYAFKGWDKEADKKCWMEFDEERDTTTRRISFKEMAG